MDQMILNFLIRFELITISFAFIIFWVLKYFNTSFIFGNEYQNFFFILCVVYIFKAFSHKFFNLMKLIITNVNEKISFYKSRERIDQLPEEQQKILNILYLKEEDKFHFYTKEIKSLIDKKFIILVQNIQGTLNLYKLDKKMYKYLNNKNINQIKDYLITLSDDEKYVLDQFYDNSQKNNYKAKFSEVLETLIDKRIISEKITDKEDKEIIVISKYAKNLLKYYRKEQIKHTEIELGKHNIDAHKNSGGGATGSYK